MKLRVWIEQRGLKQTWVADQLGMPHSTFSNIVRGVHAPLPSYAAKIIDFTNGDVTKEDLMRRGYTHDASA